MSNKYSIGQMNEVADMAEGVGITPEMFKKLSQRSFMEQVAKVLNGTHEVKLIPYLVDGDAEPFCPNNWKVESHRKMGKIAFDENKLDLYLSEGQKKGIVGGEKLRKEIEKLEGVMNANWLEFFLANPHLIPESWKGKAVMFWGTIYRGSYGTLYVRYLYWFGDAWYWSNDWLGIDFDDNDPAARARK